jgi:hypothetical protein
MRRGSGKSIWRSGSAGNKPMCRGTRPASACWRSMSLLRWHERSESIPSCYSLRFWMRITTGWTVPGPKRMCDRLLHPVGDLQPARLERLPSRRDKCRHRGPRQIRTERAYGFKRIVRTIPHRRGTKPDTEVVYPGTLAPRCASRGTPPPAAQSLRGVVFGEVRRCRLVMRPRHRSRAMPGLTVLHTKALRPTRPSSVSRFEG